MERSIRYFMICFLARIPFFNRFPPKLYVQEICKEYFLSHLEIVKDNVVWGWGTALSCFE